MNYGVPILFGENPPQSPFNKGGGKRDLKKEKR